MAEFTLKRRWWQEISFEEFMNLVSEVSAAIHFLEPPYEYETGFLTTESSEDHHQLSMPGYTDAYIAALARRYPYTLERFTEQVFAQSFGVSCFFDAGGAGQKIEIQVDRTLSPRRVTFFGYASTSTRLWDEVAHRLDCSTWTYARSVRKQHPDIGAYAMARLSGARSDDL